MTRCEFGNRPASRLFLPFWGETMKSSSLTTDISKAAMRCGARTSERETVPTRCHMGGLGVNFSLFSGHATKVELWLFDDRAKANSNASSCPNTPTKCGTAICQQRGLAPYTRIVVHGPYEPDAGHASIRTSY